MLARARALGEAEGAERRAADEARVRSAARARVLAGRRATYEELRHRAQVAVRELLQQPGQRELLAETLRARLGDARCRERDRRRRSARPCAGRPCGRRIRRRPRRPGPGGRGPGAAVDRRMTPPRLVRVNGPLLEVEGLEGVAMSELVALGRAGIPGEVVSIRGSTVTVQAYEYTGGLATGDPVAALGHPLTARLGPHLLGGVFDGLLRPLSGAPTWLVPDGRAHEAIGTWAWQPSVVEGAVGGARPGAGHGPARRRPRVPGARAARRGGPRGVARTPRQP